MRVNEFGLIRFGGLAGRMGLGSELPRVHCRTRGRMGTAVLGGERRRQVDGASAQADKGEGLWRLREGEGEGLGMSGFALGIQPLPGGGFGLAVAQPRVVGRAVRTQIARQEPAESSRGRKRSRGREGGGVWSKTCQPEPNPSPNQDLVLEPS